MKARWFVVGVPGDRRVDGFLAAAAQRGLAPPAVVPWRTLIADPSAVALRAGDRVRIESPGSDGATWRALTGLTAPPLDREPGSWRPGSAWYAGLSQTLRSFANHARAAGARFVQGVDGILTMTDKAACRARLAGCGVPVPPGGIAPTSPDALRDLLLSDGWPQVFIKPRWGSSGAGVVALRRARRARDANELAQTTLGLDPATGALTNHKRLRVYRDRAAIDAVLGPILADGAVVERWVPKLGVAAGPFDLRLVAIAGVVRHRVARVGRGPITNLHLDGMRLWVDEALANAPATLPDRIAAIVAATARAFGDCQYLGIDLAVDVAWSPWVLEVNAWGDYLPRLLDDAGHDTYWAELEAC